ncbi:MAG: hypothetical protein EA409_13810 [Saprospirales bacterium]|nr:MAG: hypothetical protein EA409_13810 [Saprospirales bacterium]
MLTPFYEVNIPSSEGKRWKSDQKYSLLKAVKINLTYKNASPKSNILVGKEGVSEKNLLFEKNLAKGSV